MRCATRRAILLLCLLGGSFAPPGWSAPRDHEQERAWADTLFTNGSLLHLKIEMAAGEVSALGQAPRRYVTATLREGDAAYPDVAVHLKGSVGSFRPIQDKPGFTLNLGLHKSGTNFHGLRKFHLCNAVQDPTYLSDWLCMGLFRDAGVPAPRCAHAFVELNGRKLGLYVLMESNDREFLARSFSNTHGNLYGQAGAGDISSPLERMGGNEPLDRADLKALVAACRESNAAKRLERLRDTLDLERFLSFMAMEVMLCDWDGYVAAQHNYRVYHDLDSGRMVFIPHDKDQMLGNPNQPFMPGSASLVAQAVLNTPEARQAYRQRCGWLFTNVLQVPVLTKRVDDIVAALRPGLQTRSPNLARDLASQAEGLKHRIIARAQGLQRQFNPPVLKPALAGVPPAKPGAPVGNAPRLKPGDSLAALWQPVHAQNASKLEKRQLNVKLMLYLKSEQADSVGAWKARILLAPGKYRFTGRAKTQGLAAQANRFGSGGGLRIARTSRKNQLIKDTDWTTLEEEFTLTAEGPVVLFCELRANRGEMWFDVESLQIKWIK